MFVSPKASSPDECNVPHLIIAYHKRRYSGSECILFNTSLPHESRNLNVGIGSYHPVQRCDIRRHYDPEAHHRQTLARSLDDGTQVERRRGLLGVRCAPAADVEDGRRDVLRIGGPRGVSAKTSELDIARVVGAVARAQVEVREERVEEDLAQQEVERDRKKAPRGERELEVRGETRGKRVGGVRAHRNDHDDCESADAVYDMRRK